MSEYVMHSVVLSARLQTDFFPYFLTDLQFRQPNSEQRAPPPRSAAADEQGLTQFCSRLSGRTGNVGSAAPHRVDKLSQSIQAVETTVTAITFFYGAAKRASPWKDNNLEVKFGKCLL